MPWRWPARHIEHIGEAMTRAPDAMVASVMPIGSRGAACRWAGGDLPTHAQRRNTMLHYAVVFFVIALIAAVLGFGGIAAGAAGIAKILFVVFLVLAVASLIGGAMRKR